MPCLVLRLAVRPRGRRRARLFLLRRERRSHLANVQSQPSRLRLISRSASKFCWTPAGSRSCTLGGGGSCGSAGQRLPSGHLALSAELQRGWIHLNTKHFRLLRNGVWGNLWLHRYGKVSLMSPVLTSSEIPVANFIHILA